VLELIPVKKGFFIGERVRLKKPHACGGEWWEVLKAGMDVTLRCLKCSRQIKIERGKFERRIKEAEYLDSGNSGSA
jgi:hypothetical protein